MDDVWLLVRIFLIVVAWGGALLLFGFALEMASRVFSRDSGGDEPRHPPGASASS